MHPNTLLFKTELGQSEIAKRAILQSRPLRNVLLLVDGKRDITVLQDMMRAISAPEDALEQLLGLGLISAPPTQVEEPVQADTDDSFLHNDSELPPELLIDTRPSALQGNPAEDLAQLSEQLVNLVSAHVGTIKAYGLQRKIAQCGNSEQLLLLLPEVKDAIAAREGEQKANALLRTLNV